MKITDEMIETAAQGFRIKQSSTEQGVGLPYGTSLQDACVRAAIEAVAPLIRAEALEEAARVAQVYKDKCDMRAAIHKKERNSQARDAALDKFEAALEIESAIRSLKDKPHE